MWKQKAIVYLFFVLLLMGMAIGPSDPAMAQASLAIARMDGSILYAQPNGAPLDALAVGAVVTPSGRTQDQQWVAVQTQDGRTGWMSSADLIGFDMQQLPILEFEPQPTEPQPTPSSMPTVMVQAQSTPEAIPGVVPMPARNGGPPVDVDASRATAMVGITSIDGADLLDTPGGTAITHWGPGLVIQVTHRTSDEAWVRAQSVQDPEQSGWSRADQLYLADIALLPVYEDAAASMDDDEEAMLPENGTPATSSDLEAASADAATLSPATGHARIKAGGDRLNIRSGPGISYAIVAKAQDGDSYAVTARSQDGTWLQLETTTGYAAQYGVRSGWVSAAFIDYAGALDSLPTLESNSEMLVERTQLSATSTATIQASPILPPSDDDLTGRLVFQSSPGGMLYAHDLTSGQVWPLTHGFDPALSPDGQTMAFVRDGGENGIYLIEFDGSNERRIFSGHARLSSPKWSPDGAWILFTRSDEFTECYRFGPGGCLEPSSLPEGFEPSAEMPLTRVYDYSLARVDRNGENYRDIVALSSARAADWNEAGIVYQSDAGLQITADIPNATNRLVLYDYLKPFYVDPDWQPNGGRIVYMGKEASHWELFAVNPEGSGRTSLTRPATALVDEIPSNVAPTWSPDGRAYPISQQSHGERRGWGLASLGDERGRQRTTTATHRDAHTHHLYIWGRAECELGAGGPLKGRKMSAPNTIGHLLTPARHVGVTGQRSPYAPVPGPQ